MELISKMFLRSGRDLELAPGVSVRHPTVAHILDINHGFLCEDYYWTYVFTILSDPYDYMVYLDDQGIDYETVTAFDVFMFRWNDAQKDYYEHKDMYQQLGTSPLSVIDDALAFFLGRRQFYIGKLANQFVIADAKDPNWLITKEAFDVAAKFITQCNCIERGDKIKPADRNAKRVLIDDMRREERKRKNKKIEDERPERIAESMATLDAGVGVLTAEQYESLPIYRLLSTARSVQKRIVVQSMLNGIYTGMMKADSVSDTDLRWA